MTNHCMIDIETLGLRPGAVITEIAAVIFSDVGYPIGGNEFYKKIDYDQVITKFGGKVDGNTLRWTIQNNIQSLDYDKTHREYLGYVLLSLNSFIREWNPEYFWANSPSFDFTLLEYWYHDFSYTPVWSHRKVMDVRTLRFLDKEYELNLPRGEATHNALEDAKAQAQYVSHFLATFNTLKNSGIEGRPSDPQKEANTN